MWAGEELSEWLFVGSASVALLLLQDGLFLVFYVLLGSAAFGELRAAERRTARPLRRLAWLETGLFVVGLFLYLVLLPLRFDPGRIESVVPSAVLYVTLDFFLIVLFVARLRRAAGPRERWRWQLFCAAAGCFVLSDALFLGALLFDWDLGAQPWTDVLWFAAHPFAAAAVRAPSDESLGEQVDEPAEIEPSAARFAPAFVYAALVPAIHLVAELSDWVAPHVAFTQRLFALLLATILGILAALHQLLIDRHQADLRAEMRETRRRLAAASKLEAIGRLAAGVAHDFNNLLTVVIGRADLLLARSDSPRTKSDLETILGASRRAADLTADLLAVGRRGMGQRHRVELHQFLTAHVPELAEGLGPTIDTRTRWAVEPLWIEIDPRHLERIVRNLVANAKDAMPDGGRLELATERLRFATNEQVRGEELEAGDYALLAVRDSGIGMSAEELRRLFEPFYTTKPQGRGSGLGLATVYGLVRQYGGQVRVESRLGSGSSFELLLPLAAGAVLEKGSATNG